ncbi:MAG: class I SAM-dependent methyltransferase [Actinomycetia bacterium]|nr:class I SAM-dependent methyltransferase [Actinomycetes bacterium]
MGSFDGVAGIYSESRHSYPSELRDYLVRIEALEDNSVVVDLGAGTGQLAALAATVASQVVAIDPEPDMVRVGRRATAELPSVRWVLGADRDLPDLLPRPVDLVLIGNAFHHMDHVRLLADLDSLVTPSGAVVVCSSSVPVWLQETDWSAMLRQHLTQELGRPIGPAGTPDHESDMADLSNSPFSDVERWLWTREQQRGAESIVGEILSSASGAIDEAAAERLNSALEPYLANGTVTENVKTTALIATRPAS